MVAPDVSTPEAVAHATFGMSVLIDSLISFIRKVDGKKRMDFAECCTYIDNHWSDYFPDDNNGIFIRAAKIQADVWIFPITVQRYTHYIEWLRMVALRIGCPHREYKIANYKLYGRRMYSSVDEKTSLNRSGRPETSTEPADLPRLLQLGKRFYRDREWSSGLDTFRKMVEMGDQSPEVRYYGGLCLFRVGLLDIAEDLAEDATMMGESRKEYFAFLAKVRIAMNKFKEALEACENGLQLDPNDEELLQLKEKCLTLIARNEPVKPYCYSELSFLEKGKIKCNLEKWSDAMTLLNEEIFRDSEQAEAYSYRSLCYRQMDLPDLACEDAEKALMLSPNRPEYYARLAEASGAFYNLEEALYICEKGLELDQTNEELLHLQKKIHGLIWWTIKKADSLSVSGSMQKGKKLYEQANWSEAAHAFNEVIVKDVKQSEAYFFRALCEIRLNMLDLARDSVEKAIRLLPDRLDYYLKLAEILIEMKKFSEALTTCVRGLELDNSNERLLLCKRSCLNEIERNKGGD